MEAQRKTTQTANGFGYHSSSLTASDSETTILVAKDNGTRELLKIDRLYQTIVWAVAGYEHEIDINLIVQEALKNMFDGIRPAQISEALVLACVSFIERDPAYGRVAAKLLYKKLFKEASGQSARTTSPDRYQKAFIDGIKKGVTFGLLDQRLLTFDLEYLATHLCIENDALFDYMGLRTLYERYFLKHDNMRFELPQAFWMRIAMGLCLLEENKEQQALDFYRLMSGMYYVPGTPTLLHSGMVRPQLSSCFLSTVEDDLHHIFKVISDNAQLAKWSGGVANDWTNVRATGAGIKSINVESQGVIPFLKIASDTTAAINRSGKRRGAAVVYLETWHLDIEDFLDLRRNTGDERRRTHDINTANWIPDLFMKRVEQDAEWTLFSPEEVPDLHHIYGKKFEERYCWYEQQASSGYIKKSKKVSALKLWRKMLSRLFETGHPWITFKDPCNLRSPQDHAGVVHCSNLCTEITLNTSASETAVCNLGSINLERHVIHGQLDHNRLACTVQTAMRALDNVIDITFYPTAEAKNANLAHRAVGLGLMGFQDALYLLDINFQDQQALTFADNIMEFIAYHAILASSQLAKERGTYDSYKGSKWDRAILPQDTIDILQQEREMPISVSRAHTLDWSLVREHIKQYGMRNSNTMAIAPTATISNIVGCFPCIEPIYKNLYVKANMSGEFTVINKYLVNDLKKIGLWNATMLDQLKYYDGNVQMVAAIPDHIKNKYQEAFEIDPEWLIEITAARGKWIDQSQSHNVFMRGASGTKLHNIYMKAWHKGLKTTYYLRTLGASQVEKSTLEGKQFGFTQKRSYKSLDQQAGQQIEYTQNLEQAIASENNNEQKACSISEDPSCEVCQ